MDRRARRWRARPFASLAHLKRALVRGRARRRRATRSSRLIRAHPELAGKAMVSADADRRIDATSRARPASTDCTPEEFATIAAAQRRLQREVRLPVHPGRARAARHGPDARREIIATFERRLAQPRRTSSSPSACATSTASPSSASTTSSASTPDARQPGLGLGRAARRAQRPGLRRARPAHRHLPHRRAPRLRGAARRTGCARLRLRRGDDRRGRQRGRRLPRQRSPARSALLTGSHYDTVRNGGKYDGRLGIFVPMACVRELHARRAGACRSASRWSASPRRKASATRRPSSARARSSATSTRAGSTSRTPTASRCARRCSTPGCARRRHRRRSQRDPARYLGFVEVHIEQGPVLNELDLPLGVVTSINGGVRYVGEVDRHGEPRRHHADGPAPRRRRRGRRARALRREARRARRRTSVGTIGMLEVPNGSINVVPGPLPVQPRHPRARPTRVRDALRRRRAGRAAARSASAAACATRSRRRCAPPPRRARRPGSARWERAVDALGPAGAPHAERRRPRRDEAARGDAAGDAVRARRELRHQPQPARIEHQRRHRSSRSRAFPHLLDDLAAEQRRSVTTRHRRQRRRRGSPAATWSAA